MIQRIQTLLLAAAVVLNLATMAFPVWQYQGTDEKEVIHPLNVVASYQNGGIEQSQPFYTHPWQIAWVAFNIIGSAVLLWAIFLYKKRPFQIRIVYAGGILTMLQILSIILFTRQGPFILGVSGKDEAAFGIIFPMVTLMLAMFAARRIKADEELVRSADRLR